MDKFIVVVFLENHKYVSSVQAMRIDGPIMVCGEEAAYIVGLFDKWESAKELYNKINTGGKSSFENSTDLRDYVMKLQLGRMAERTNAGGC